MVFLSACVRAVDVLLFVHVAQKGALASASEFEMAEPDGDSGFRSEYRLRKTDEFSSVFAFRRALRSKHFDMHHRSNLSDTARLGVVIGKKFVRSAVKRNLVRRIVRESFRLSRTKLPQRDIVVRVSARMDTPNRRALRGEIDELFARLAQ
jgi:ribonuclease P protein component